MKKHIANNRIAPKKLNKIKNRSSQICRSCSDRLFSYLCNHDERARETLDTDTAQDVLKTFVEQSADWEWTEENLHEKLEAFRGFYKEKGIKPKVTMWAIRAAVTGRLCGADMTAILAILGKEHSLNRAKKCILANV